MFCVGLINVHKQLNMEVTSDTNYQVSIPKQSIDNIEVTTVYLTWFGAELEHL